MRSRRRVTRVQTAARGKPVGTIYIALARPGETLVKRISLFGDRARIREIATLHAFDLLRRKLCLE
jgi:nicotinamide-nucleotide amidase